MKKNKAYELWKEYNDFIRSLHLKTVEEQEKDSKRERISNYIKKLFIIFFGSFFTTLTFQFFITPNKLFNSGLNGIIQVLTRYYFSKNMISEDNYSIVYYTIVFFINLFLVFFVHLFSPENFEMNSTAIFYVLFQFILSRIFNSQLLKNSIFSRFAPRTWSNLSNSKQLGLTLPFYITIGIFSSFIHTYGYSLIYRAKSTPGGLEIITSTISQKQNKESKFSIGKFTKKLGIFIVFLITLFNFAFNEDSVDLKENDLIMTLNDVKNNIKYQEKSINKENLHHFLDDWKNGFFKNEKDKDIEILNILKNWSYDDDLDKNRTYIIEYLKSNKCQIKYFLEERNRLKITGINVSSLDQKIKDLELNTYESGFLGYLKYITNDEKLWASIIYIYLSSYLINKIFPKNKFVSLVAFIENREDLNDMLKILDSYEPLYYEAKNRFDKSSYILNCSITKWNYQLLSNELEKLGKILINEVD
ncbi:MAG: hypothetical protein AM1032_000073 [Mycoplasmataceae bacterium]|nr:MAG: hypothetical protein AM1032_000073 [Mycoplasmataceae bacterium]